MANESVCCIEAKGHSSDISRLINEVLNPESLNFNAITPMPSEITLKLNAKGEAGDAYREWLRDNWGTKWDSPSAPKFGYLNSMMDLPIKSRPDTQVKN